eukprot:SAG22_NODE_28_length_28728_cov_19.603619_22_plen_68_part_00
MAGEPAPPRTGGSAFSRAEKAVMLTCFMSFFFCFNYVVWAVVSIQPDPKRTGEGSKIAALLTSVSNK